jgi:hypothetical protein
MKKTEAKKSRATVPLSIKPVPELQLTYCTMTAVPEPEGIYLKDVSEPQADLHKGCTWPQDGLHEGCI